MGYWSSKTELLQAGTLAVESTLESGVWKHAFNISDRQNSALEPDAQFTIEWPISGWEDPQQVKKIHTSFTQGPKAPTPRHQQSLFNLMPQEKTEAQAGWTWELQASLTGSWSEGFSLDSLLLPFPYDPPP